MAASWILLGWLGSRLFVSTRTVGASAPAMSRDALISHSNQANMNTRLFLISLFLAGTASAQRSPSSGEAAENPLLKKFDANGDGQLDDEERRNGRETLRQLQNKPGATTPSGKTETIGEREVTEMQYASSDGRKIPCVLSMPKGDGPFPILVTIHGGQGNRDFGYIRTMAAPNPISPTVNAFNEQPWAILAVSYRSGNGALFGMEHDDVIAGIRFAKTLPRVDAARVGVVGGSHGGHLALVAAEKMGREFLCVAVGSPWMTDPVVYMTGDPGQPPLSLVRQEAREELVKNGQSLFNRITLARGLSEREAKDFLVKNSIEANADKIEVPTLFLTSLGDDQAPHALIEPMIQRMKAAGKDLTTYTAQKSPHGFYWARTVSAARALRGEKSEEEENEEKTARETMIAFFTKQFARRDVQALASPPSGSSASKPATAAPETISAKDSKWVLPDVTAPGMKRVVFNSKAAGGPVSCYVFTPGGYDQETERRFPVLYWLHGSGGSSPGAAAQVAKRYGEAMQAGKIQPMILVFPNGLPQGMWCDWKDGSVKLETILIGELIPYIDLSHRTLAQREGRIIEGFSMGGYGAARLGFKHPQMFAAVSLLGAGPLQPEFDVTPRASPRAREEVLSTVYGSDMAYYRAQSPWQIAQQNAGQLKKNLTIRQVVGERDETLDFNRDFHRHLAALQIPHTYRQLPGIPHDPNLVLNTLGEDNWGFYQAALAGLRSTQP
jgi:enterochelin esterase-like enzyme